MRTRASILIGRESELTAALGRLRSDGPAGFLIGEPGVGKSRLIGEVTKQLQADGWVVARGRASSVGPVSPLRLFAEALAGIHRCGLLPDDNLGGYRPLLARVLPELAGPVPAEAPPLVAFAEAVLRLLSMLGRSAAGCLLVLEDLHDADPDSLAVLEYLLDTAGSSVALLGALRDQPSDARDLLIAAERRGPAELLPIRPLNRMHTGPLVGACLGADQPPAQLIELAWRNTAGNPLAVEELLYHLIEEDQLHQHGKDWQLSAPPSVALPPGMLQLIGSRIDRMDQLARRLVITAAVYGEQFPLAATQAALDVGEVKSIQAIHDTTAAQLIVAERPGWYRFHHPLTHAAVLELANQTERRHAARRLAEAILAENPGPTEASCRTAARLLAEAGQTAKASALYARTGKLALGNGAIEVAVADLTEARRLTEPGVPLSAGLISDLVRAWRLAGQFDRAVELVDGLTPADRRERQQMARIHLDLARGCDSAGRGEQARLQLATARALAAGMDSELLQIHCEVTATFARYCATGAANPVGDERQVRAMAEAAERLVSRATETSERQAAAEVACQAWGILMWSLGYQNRYQEATRLRRRIHAVAEQHNLPHWVAHAREEAALEQSWIDGDDLPVRALLDQAQRCGNVAVALAIQVVLWEHQVMTSPGSLAPVVAGLTGCAEQARRLGFRSQYEYAVGGLIWAAHLRADRHAVARTLAQYDDAASAYLKRFLEISRMFSLVLDGRDSEALATLQDLERRGLIGRAVNSLQFGLQLLLGTLAGTAPPEQIAEALSTSLQIRWARQFLHWAAAVHAGRSGDRNEAERHAEQAATEAQIYPVTRHLAARLVAPAAHADGWGHPIEDLRAAEAWFHEQGVAVAARTCRDLLRSLGAPIQQRRHGTTAIPAELRAAGLTLREYEVGLLVREHLGNRDIGQRLHISPRTVEKHIAGLLTKLNLPDRRALIDRMAEANPERHSQPAAPDRLRSVGKPAGHSQPLQ